MLKKNSTHYTLHSALDKPVLLISASDSSAAAGMQVDLRVLNDLGSPARCSITAVTVQGDGGAMSINSVDPDIINESILTALSDLPGIGAVKIGLLGEASTAKALEVPLARIKGSGIPIVVDPVMRSTPGSALSTEDTAATILEKVLPWTALLTPNRDELEALSNLMSNKNGDEAQKVQQLLKYGAGGILVTGGDTEDDQCVDILYELNGTTTEFKHPRIGERPPRGTGCALSTAIAVHLGRGIPMVEAVSNSIEYVTGLIEKAVVVGDQLLLFPGRK
ncbi:MAG: hydroxymethylpyrimidine/phosphomethylpyrimidine kinase [bacterium]|nr:hydroxymethylpyrimidine/phosphomethylpyrimidine kinase [bacterium]MDT8366530.1 hydroxymethylpyrimidine/phosphomethylpyrimidine kinase [bacterium]